jgi:hypothetical protein
MRWIIAAVAGMNSIWVGMTAAQTSTEFEPPVRLRAGGDYVDSGTRWGHSGPCLADVDADGLRDLVVGDFSGKFMWYRNVGTSATPTFAPGTFLQAGGAEAEVRVY